jgi:hypothetical protein
MQYHQIKILNLPEPPSEELFVQKVACAHRHARRWAEAVNTSGIGALLLPKDRSVLHALVAQAHDRQLLSPAGCDAVIRLARSCAARIADLAHPDAPDTRKRALALHDAEQELHDLGNAIAEVLDFRAALEMRHRIRQNGTGRPV